MSRRIHLSRDHIAELDKDQLVAKWYQQESYLNHIENANDQLVKQVETLQQELQTSEIRYKKRLNNVCMKLTSRDRKLAQLSEKLAQISHPHNTPNHQLESSLIDPAINLMFEKMKSEVEIANAKVEEMQNELSAWKFTPDSTTGKRLMAKCRLLHNENEELGKEMSTGWVAQLNGNLALQKKFSEEMKKSQTELDEFLLELEEEVEGMQNTIYFLQQQLRDAKSQAAASMTTSTEVIPTPPTTGIATTTASPPLVTNPTNPTTTTTPTTPPPTTITTNTTITSTHQEQQPPDANEPVKEEKLDDVYVKLDEQVDIKMERDPISSAKT